MKKKLLILLMGFAMGSSMQALEIDADGYYKIGTSADLVEFSTIVNTANQFIKGKLMNDIDMSDVPNFYPIGEYADDASCGVGNRAFAGTFDGQGHVIKNLKVSVDKPQEAGLFGRCSEATIQNLGLVNVSVVNTMASGGSRLGGLLGEAVSQTTIKNVFVVGDIELETTHAQKGAIAGEAAGGNLKNCYTTYSTLVASLGTKVNCYEGDVAIAKGATGELCYLLNEGETENPVFRQTIGTDPYPVFSTSSGIVYQTTPEDCAGNPKSEPAYSNNSGGERDPHTFNGEGICTVCGYDAGVMSPVDGWYEISTPYNLRYFSALVKNGDQFIKGKLMNDIDMSGMSNFYPIGEWADDTSCGVGQHVFGGIFDGQRHIIKNLKVSVDKPQEAGLFGRCGSATIQNLGLVNVSVENTMAEGGVRLGGLLGEAAGTIIKNVFVAGDIELKTTHAQTGGIAGEAAGAKLTNCYTTYSTLVASLGTKTNCYWGEDAIAKGATGELCYLLNEGETENPVFRQTIGTDSYPVFDTSSAIVYQATAMDCGGTPKGEPTYSNTPGQRDPHTLNDLGICTVCSFDAGAMSPVGDWYEISTPYNLRYFSTLVNTVNQFIKGKLMNDIDMSGMSNFYPIGEYADDPSCGVGNRAFAGTFDGQGHVIKNLKVSVDKPQEAGLFGRCSEATIQNLGLVNVSVVNTMASGGSRLGGLLGEAVSQTTIKNVFVVGDIELETTHAQKGAIAGEAAGGHLTNCYTTYPTLVASLGTKTNCYEGEDAIAKGATGELCYLLNGGTTVNPIWRQTIGEDTYPLFDTTHGIVKQMNETGYATLYIPTNDVTLSAGVEAYAGIITSDMLQLKDALQTVPAATAVVLKGSGYYSITPTTGAEALAENDLKGTAEPLEATGTQYVLAEKDGVVGFYKATGTIPAGKAYIEYGVAPVKAFLFGNNATGIADIKNATDTNATIYDLSGHRVEKVQRGIYIVNGKKVLK